MRRYNVEGFCSGWVGQPDSAALRLPSGGQFNEMDQTRGPCAEGPKGQGPEAERLPLAVLYGAVTLAAGVGATFVAHRPVEVGE